ncbi:MAG: response regulator [Patescibacteria group bacterium]
MPKNQPVATVKTILIAEDDRFLLKTLTLKLKKAGYNIITAVDGYEALAKYKDSKANLMLLDLVMPKKSGFEVLKEINKDGEKKLMPIMVLSNLGQESDIEQVKTLGVDTYLIKANYTLQQIVDEVKKQIA